jgi:phospholipase C
MDLPEGLRGQNLTRRQILTYFGMLGASAVVSQPAAAWAAGSSGARLVKRAAATEAAGSDLGAVDHIVFLMIENRSYDQYFGDYPRGRGFNDHPAHSLGVFAQDYPGGGGLVPPNKLLPFHLDSTAGMECTDDLTHDWGPQRLCWNQGKMDSWVKVHTSSTYEGANGAMTMGYYQRSDLAFYYALADAFTLCDHYHSSILGPTHPNRLMANSGTIDPAGTHGGPVTDTSAGPDLVWNCTWTPVQELLQDAGVSWKVYSPSNVGVTGKYASLAQYPSSAPANGMYFTSLVLDALTSNPKVWAKTALFLMYDENDGWFDHVPPPTAPAGTPGEYLTATPPPLGDPQPDTLSITGPLGLGVRVPMLVISPFSRGGHIASEVFDHTSQLKLVSERFGVGVPNVSAWRRKTVGDLTSTLFQSKTNTAVPKLPATAVDMPASGPCAAIDQDTESGGAAPSVPTKQRMPTQGGGSQPASDYYTLTPAEREVPDEHRTLIANGRPGSATTKSSYNRLARVPG